MYTINSFFILLNICLAIMLCVIQRRLYSASFMDDVFVEFQFFYSSPISVICWWISKFLTCPNWTIISIKVATINNFQNYISKSKHLLFTIIQFPLSMENEKKFENQRLNLKIILHTPPVEGGHYWDQHLIIFLDTTHLTKISVIAIFLYTQGCLSKCTNCTNNKNQAKTAHKMT